MISFSIALRKAATWALFVAVRNLWFLVLFTTLVLSVLFLKHIPVIRHVPLWSRASSSFDHAANQVSVVVQLSDTHIALDNSPQAQNLRSWCSDALPVIKPGLVLLSGDIVNSNYTKSPFVAAQSEQQWKTYKQIWSVHCRRFYNTTWAEIKGNHDQYGVVDTTSAEYWYPANYTAAGSDILLPARLVSASPNATASTPSFILINSNLKQIYWPSMLGGNRPELTNDVRSLVKRMRDSGQLSIVVAHHPLNLITQQWLWSDLITQLTATGDRPSFFLSGHLHETIYTRHSEGTVELVATTFQKKVYRVLVFDNGLMSFTDATMGVWPVIVLTTPKSATFISADEPLGSMKTAHCIRAAVFSPSPIVVVNASLDGRHLCQMSPIDSSSMWSCEWLQSESLSSGLHTMEIIAADKAGNLQRLTQQISLDGTVAKEGYAWWSYIITCKTLLLIVWWVVATTLLFLLLVVPRLTKLFSLSPRLSAPQQSLDLINAVDSEKITFEEFLTHKDLSAMNKAFTMLTWQLQSTIASHAAIPWPLWAVMACAWLVQLCSPIVIRVYQSQPSWIAFGGVSFAGYSKDSYPSEFATFTSLVFLFTVLFPFMSAAARRYERPHHKPYYLRVSFYSILMCVVQLVGTVLVFGLLWRFLKPIYTSPITYLTIICDLGSIAFLVLSFVKPKGASFSTPAAYHYTKLPLKQI